MNDIDFIKKCCEYADGFRIIGGDIVIPSGDYITNTEKHYQWPNLIYPLLLQRAIEGVNNGCVAQIIQADEEIESLTTKGFRFKTFRHAEHKSIDATKRAVLEYVFEQESKDVPIRREK